MAIYLRGKSYYYDFVYKHQRYTGCIGPVSKTVAKEEEARKKAEVIEGRLNLAKARKSPRFEAFAKEYLEWCRTNKKPTTCTRNALIINHLIVFFGSKKLDEVSSWLIEKYKKERKEAGLYPGSVNLELSLLKALLRKAMLWGKLAADPTRDVQPLKVVARKTRFLSEEEEARILAVCSPTLRHMIQAGLLTGFRRQELVTLRPESVDLQRGTVSVEACYSKNSESRTLPMGPRLSALMQEALAARGSAPAVFVTEKGEAWNMNSFCSVFRKACQQAGVGSLGPHVLRHTFASRLVMAGVDLRTVQELMGHKDIKMTLKYAHLSPDHKRNAMATLESRFSGESPAESHNSPSFAVTVPHLKRAAVQ